MIETAAWLEDFMFALKDVSNGEMELPFISLGN